MWASSILSQAIMLGLTTSRLPPFKTHPPSIFIVDLLQAVGCWDGKVFDIWFVLTSCPFKLSLVFNSHIHFSNMRCVLLIKLYKVLIICMDILILTVIVYGVQCFHISAAYCYLRKNQYWLVPGLVLGKQTSRSKGLFSILWCTGNHPQEELAKFGYVLTTYVSGTYWKFHIKKFL
jgi:hypothetical protein